MTNPFDWPNLTKIPEAEIVVVIAPHMDDEVIGCAGALTHHIFSGSEISVIYMTDGAKGVPGKPPNKELKQIRKVESNASNKILGIHHSYYLDLADGTEDSWDESLSRLVEILTDKKPDIVYIPFEGDLHPDHKKTNKLFRAATKGNVECLVYVYEVWSPLIKPNVLINITKQMPVKLRALKSYKSQLRIIRYDKMVLSLNAYRACFVPFPGMRFAEAFFIQDSKGYCEDVPRDKISQLGNINK